MQFGPEARTDRAKREGTNFLLSRTAASDYDWLQLVSVSRAQMKMQLPPGIANCHSPKEKIGNWNLAYRMQSGNAEAFGPILRTDPTRGLCSSADYAQCGIRSGSLFSPSNRLAAFRPNSIIVALSSYPIGCPDWPCSVGEQGGVRARQTIRYHAICPTPAWVTLMLAC